MLNQRNNGAHVRPVSTNGTVNNRPSGRHETSTQRELDHTPRLIFTGPRHRFAPVRPDSDLGSTVSKVAVAHDVDHDVHHSTHAFAARHAAHSASRRAWAGIIARKRRISLVAVTAAAIAVGSAGLSGAAPDGAIRSTLDETLSALDEAPSTAQVVQSLPSVDSAKNFADLAKGAWFDQQRAIEAARQFRPLYVKYTTGVFTSGFGMRWGAMHGGIDVANAVGTPIMAVGDGVIIKANDAGDGYGNSVKIRHTDGTVTHYGHMSQVLVTVGQQVLAGDQIGLMGSTGDSTGPHCHFEVYVGGEGMGNRIDPLPWLASRGIDVGGLSD